MINVEKIEPTGLFTNYIYKAIPLAFDESMSYYETLCGLLSYLKDTVIPTLNNNADAIIEVQNLMTQLQSYVDNYFDNLDVQEEINNKLDEMAESGQLTDIIAQYLGLAGMFTFNTVADMKLAENLVNGSKCTTLGYSSINDGGKATYLIRTITNEDTVDESFLIALYDNTLVAELIYENPINILQLGCNEIDNNTNLLQSALDKGLDLLIPEKTFKTDSLSLKFNKQKITGLSENSVLKANSITTGLIKIESNYVDCEISNLKLYGDFKSGDGIYVNHTSLNEDSKEIIKNVYVDYFDGNGINFNTANIHSAIITDCKIRNCTGYGIRMNGTDNFIDNTICWFNTLHGLFIDASGSNSKISNSKFYGNSECGIYCIGSCCNFTNVESQDNYKQGIYLKGWNENVDILCGNNCQQDTNKGQIYCDGVYDSIIKGCVNVTQTSLTILGVAKYAIECNGNNLNNDIDIVTHKFGSVNIIPFKYNPRLTNRVTINGIKYFPENAVADKKLGKIGDITNLSELFTEANIRANSDGSIVCSSTDQTQYMTIGNNVTGDYTSGITLVGELNLDESVTKVDVYTKISSAITYDSTIATFELNMIWINSGGGAISNVSQSGTSDLFVTGDKPENAVKMKYQINFFPRQTGINLTAGITNLQVGLYN